VTAPSPPRRELRVFTGSGWQTAPRCVRCGFDLRTHEIARSYGVDSAPIDCMKSRICHAFVPPAEQEGT